MESQEQYPSFFEEIRNITMSFGLTNEHSFIGLSEKEIKDFEEERGISFGENWKVYLRSFGCKFDGFNYSLSSMKRAEKVQDEESQDLEEGDEKIDWVKEIGRIYQKSFAYKENNIVLIGTLLEGGAVQYIMANDKELRICNYDIDQKKIGYCSPFKTIFRNYFYYKFFHKNEVHEKIKNRIPWLRYLDTIKEKFPSWDIPRSEYYPIAHERELEENRIMGIDEFETEFIKFLIEEKGFKRMPEVFDPYAPLVTFEEYLNNQII